LFALLGSGLGAAAGTFYFNTRYELGETAYDEALDMLLDNPDFLDRIADDVLVREYGESEATLDAQNTVLDGLDAELDALTKELQDKLQEQGQR